MAFLASCPDCGQSQICVLSRDGGPRLRCSRCRSIYPSVWYGNELALATTLAESAYEPAETTATLVVVQNLPSFYPKKQKRPKQKRRKRKWSKILRALPVPENYEPPVSIADLEPQIEPEPQVEPEPIASPLPPIIQPLNLTVSSPALPRPHRKPVRKWTDDQPEFGLLQLNTATVLTLFVVAGALASSSIESVSGLVRPLAGVGVAVGLVAAVTSGLAGRRLMVPIALAGIAVAVFVVAFAVPELLGLNYARSRESHAEVTEVQVVPHLPFAADAELRSAEWVDAGKATLQQGGTKVEVVDAQIERTPQDGQNVLKVRVRLHQQIAIVTSPGWRDDSKTTLRDVAGSVYQQQAGSSAAAGTEGRPVGIGVTVRDTVLAFTVPAGARGPFRLELSAAAWGGAGAFKFEIPSSMVRR